MRWSREELQAQGYRIEGDRVTRIAQDTSRAQDDSPVGGGGDDTLEGALLAQVRRCALENGWRYHHVLNSRGCDPGFPDVCAVKPGHPLLMLELKSERGKLTQEQVVWLEFLAQTTGTHVAVYRPSQWALIEALLTRRLP